MQGERGLMASSTACPAQHRQRAGQAQANRADIRIRVGAETGWAAAKDLRLRTQLHMDFKADNRLVPGEYVLRYRNG